MSVRLLGGKGSFFFFLISVSVEFQILGTTDACENILRLDIVQM